MNKRTFLSYLSIVISCLTVVYYIIVAIIDSGSYLMAYNPSIIWRCVVLGIIVCNCALLILSKSNVACIVSLFSLVPCMMITDGVFMFVIPFLYLTVYVIQKKLFVKIAGIVTCVFLILMVVGLAYTPTSQSIENVSMDYYESPDGTYEARVEISYWLDGVDERDNTYTYSVAAHKINLLNLGPIVFHGQYKGVYQEEMLSEKPIVEFEWINDHALAFNGRQYDISFFIK